MRTVLLSLFLVVGLFASKDNNIKIFTENYPPYNMKVNNKLTGISVEVLDAMFKQMKSSQTIDDVTLTNWSRAYGLALKKKNHMVFSTSKTKEREPLFKWVGPIYQTSLDLIALKKKHIVINNDKDLNKYKIGTILNDVANQVLLQKGVLKKNIQQVGGEKAISISFTKLEKNRIDMFAYILISAKYSAKKDGFDFNDYESVYSIGKYYGYFAFNKGTDDKIIAKWQKALDDIKSNGIYDSIMSKY